MSEWKETTASALISFIVDNRGKNPPYSNSGYEVIETGCISGKGKFPDFANVQKFVNEETYQNWFRKGHPKKDDLLIITVGNGIGSVAIMPENRGAITQNLIGLRFNKELADSHFYYYFFSQASFQDYLRSLNIGSAQPSLKMPHILGLELPIPPLEEQNAIASVLSSLDDKIDLLHRQNQTLEQMAETLFRQWFVENPNPEWEERPLSEFGQIICGKTPSKKKPEYFDGEFPFIKIPDMHGKTFVFDTQDSLSEEGFLSQKKKALPAKSINVSCIATVGLVTMNAFPSQTNQQINSIIPDDEYRYYLFCEMKNSYDLLHAMASGGTATLNLNTGNFSKIPVLQPDGETIYRFNEFVSPMFDKIFDNQTQIRTLTALRDTLLPKLMSGEVRVESE